MNGKHVYLLIAISVTVAVLVWLRRPSSTSDAELRALMVQASSGDPAERLHAMERLVKLGPDAVPVLKQLLEHQDPVVRSVALMGAGRLGTVAAPLVPLIRQQLRQREDARLRHEAIVALARVAPREFPTFPEVVAAFEDSDGAVRESAVRGLAGGGKRSVPLLIRALDSEDRQMQAAGLHTAARLGEAAAEAVPSIVRLTSTDRPLLRLTAYCALGKVGAPAEKPLLAMLCDRNDLSRRLGAAVGLALAGPHTQNAVQQLIKALGDENGSVALAAGLALARSHVSQAHDTFLAQSLQAVALDKRRTATKLQASVAGEVWKMVVGLRSGDWYSALRFLDTGLRIDLDRRIGALLALGSVAADQSGSFEALQAAVRSPEPLLRRAACVALAEMAPKNSAAVDVLETLCNDPDLSVRSIAQRLVERVQTDEFTRYVSHAAGDQSRQQR